MARLQEYLDLDPSNADLQAALGVAQARVGKLEEAIESLEAAHYLQPDRADILFHYGKVLQKAGRSREARRRFEAVLRLAPEHAEARRQLANLSAAPPGGEASSVIEGAVVPPAGSPAPADVPISEAYTPADPTQPFGRESSEPSRSGERPLTGAAPLGRTLPPDFRGGDADSRPAFRRRPAARFDPFNVPGEADDFLPPPPPLPGWEPEQLPGFLGLFRATLYLWGQQPLVWIALLALPNIGAILLAQAVRDLEGEHQWLGLLVWTFALGLGAAPVMIAMADQWFHGRVFSVDRELIPGRLLRGIPVTLAYVMATLGLFGVLLALRSRFSGDVLLLFGLVLAAPFHALMAPALVMAVNEGPGGWQAFRSAAMMAGKRTWMHLALIVAVGVVVGGALGALAWAFAVTLKLRGEAGFGVMRVAGISLAESLWVALVTICGTDTLAARNPEGAEEPDGPEEPQDGEIRDPAQPPASDPQTLTRFGDPGD